MARPAEPRQAASELCALLVTALGEDLLGLYLFGSLSTGDFYPGRSDLDFFAVIASEFDDDVLEKLHRLHAEFVAAHPDWDDRVEVGYFPKAALATLTTAPSGTIAVVSPGEPFHARAISADWLINWHGVCTAGETLVGPPPNELGPKVGRSVLERAVRAQVGQWSEWIESQDFSDARPFQGYAIVTMCRCLYTLRHGGQASKEGAARWAAGQFPAWGDLIRDAIVWHRSGVREGIDNAVTASDARRFVRFAVDQAGRSS